MRYGLYSVGHDDAILLRDLLMVGPLAALFVAHALRGRLHPAFAVIEPAKMVKDGLSAPLHPGAAKFYKEKGWIN